MNWKSTLLLVVLAAGAGVWLWKGDEWAPRLAPKTAPPDPPALAALETDFTPANITKVEINPATGDPFVFERTAAGWTQSGDWPLLAVAVDELVEALGALRTRFQPVPLPSDADLAPFGLADAQKPLVVKVTVGAKPPYVLKFGEAPLAPGESPFTRPAYVRVNDDSEVLKLGSDVLPVLRRPADTYRRRQLFPDIERVKVAGAAPPFAPPGAPPEAPVPNTLTLPGTGVAEIRVAGKGPKVFGFTPWALDGKFALKRIGPTPAPTATESNADPTVQPDRLADAWAVESFGRDRPDPSTLQRVLAGVPDLWVEKFVPAAEASFALDHPYALAQLLPIPLEPFPAALVRLRPDAAVLAPIYNKVPAAARARMDKSEQSVTVVAAGRPVTVKFGGTVAVVREETETRPPSGPDAQPETVTRLVTTAHRYAQLEGNPQLFTVPADKVTPLFVKAGDLVDSRVARFSADEVRRVTIARPGKGAIVLTSKKGDKKSTKPEEKEDRWFIEQGKSPLLADPDRVREFINRLAGLGGDSDTDLYRADPKARGLDPATAVTVTVVVREKRPEKAPDAPAREYKILVGAPDFAAGKLPVQLAGWPRISLVPDRVGQQATGWLAPVLFPDRLEPVFQRDSVAYRSRKLFDTTDTKLAAVAVEGASGFALKQEKVGPAEVWKLTAPIASDADPANAAALVGQLANLQATEFISESTDLAEFGLDKPKFTAALTFSDAQGSERTYTLEVGKPRPGKPEVFARLKGSAVFGLSTAATDALASGALKLLPLQVWTVPTEKLTAVEVTRPDAMGESFALANEANNWKLSAPFVAPVPYQNVQPLLARLGTLPAASYEALSAPDPAKYGFDKPFAKVKLTYTEKTSDGERPASKAVVIGGVTPGGFDRFAKLDDPAAPVFVVPGPYLLGVSTSPLGLLDRNLLRVDASKITKVQIAGDKPESAVTLLKDEKGVWRAEGAAFAVDSLVAGQVVNTLAPLPVERLAAFGDAVPWANFGLDKPEYTVTVTLGGDKPATHKLQLGKPDPTGGRFARVDDGKAVGVIRSDAVRALTRTKLDFADRALLSFKPEELVALSRTRGKEELELAPDAGTGWDVTKPAKQKADKLLVEELAEALGRLRAEKVAGFGKKAEIFKQYGLEPPEATITLTVGDKPKVLLLGKPVDPAKPDGDRYATVEAPGADAAVGVLPAALAQQLLAPPVSFRDRTIAKFVDADKLELVHGPRKVTFAKVNATWKVTAPLTTDAEQAALDDLVGTLAQLRASDWAAEKPTPAELKTFGLENPEAQWTVSNADKVVLVLKIGKRTADGRVYATAGTGGMVALLSPTTSAKVLGEYRVRKPWTLDAFQAEAVEIARGDKTFTLQKLGTAWVDPAAPGDVIDPRAITELLGALTALRVERFAVDADGEPKLFGLEKPEATITVTLKDGAKRVLEVGGVVGGTDDKQRYARVVEKGRSDVFVLSAADTARFTRDRAVYVPKK